MKIEDFASDLTLRKLQIRFVNGLANVSSSQNDSYIQDSACQKGCQIGHIEGLRKWKLQKLFSTYYRLVFMRLILNFVIRIGCLYELNEIQYLYFKREFWCLQIYQKTTIVFKIPF